jgi:glucose/arabinose dehydrogenase/mono/diheme cytochrome c family protein
MARGVVATGIVLLPALGPARAAPETIALPGERLFPESITSTADGTLYVSSIAGGGVVRVRPGASTGEAWIAPGAFGTRSTLGVLADERSGTLWVCSNDLSALGIPGPGAVTGSHLKGFDLASGEGRASVALPGERTLCNDIAIGPDGAAYVTNTLAPQVLRLKPGASTFEVFTSDPQFGPDGAGAGLDGLAFGQDGNLYLNTFTKAELFRVAIEDGRAGAVTRLRPSRALVLADGMRPTGDGSFLMVEGGGRLDRVTVSGNEARIETLREELAGPTGVTKVGGTAFVSEGQLDALFVPSAQRRAPTLPFRVHAVPLGDGSVATAATQPECRGDNGGLSLPAGFCATVFADGIGHARHMAVAEDGTLYVNTWSGRYYKTNDPAPDGFLVALKDTDGDGRADVTARFGERPDQGGRGGTGLALFGGAVFAESNDRIMRYPLRAGEVAPSARGEVVVSGLPLTGDHPMHPFAITPKGEILVDLGSATNACEVKNRMPGSPGHQPCTEKETRGGIWRYDARKANQAFSPAERYAAGIRNGEGIALDAAGRAFATQHGRDQLHENWPALYSAQAGFEMPAEEMVELKEGGDYGWPECYFDPVQKKLVLAPEYGGDGAKTVGLCAGRQGPVAVFPAHWAPNDMTFYVTRAQAGGAGAFPSAYEGGAFIAFHGSWNRAPGPQGGYNVVFQPMREGRAGGDFVVFADGFAGAVKEPGRARHRPSGLAVGPDGALFISDDVQGRIWRMTYRGGDRTAAVAAAPAAGSSTGSSRAAAPPEGVHPDAGRRVATLTLPAGVSREEIALGERVFHGEVAGATCGGCHGSDAKGSPIGPDLTSGTWLWSDGSLKGIERTIATGVAEPKEHGGAMPPMGGVQLSDAELRAVAAYAWAVGHSPGQAQPPQDP